MRSILRALRQELGAWQPLPVAAAAASGALFVAAIGGLGLIGVLLLRGGDGEPLAPVSGALSPPASIDSGGPLSPPAEIDREPTPLPTLEPTDGILVYRRGTDLWVASLDGGVSLPPRAITTDSLGAGYAGYVRRPDGGIDLYYVEQLTDESIDRDRYVADFGLYRTTLHGTIATQLLRFEGRPVGGFLPTNAEVSPNGDFVAFAEFGGLSLLDLSTGDTRRLLDNVSCLETHHSCYGFYLPNWNPAGTLLTSKQIFYEGATEVILDPYVEPIILIEPKKGGLRADWSPGGDRVCLNEGSAYGDGMTYVFDIQDGSIQEITAVLKPFAGDYPLARSSGCAWSDDGNITLAIEIAGELDSARIAVLRSDYTVSATSRPIANFYRLAGWLPNGSVIFQTWNQHNGERIASAYSPESGEFTRLPLDISWVFGIIP